MKSIHALILVSVIWFCLGTLYYPKWKKGFTEAVISWDVSGYYHYLPAIFIYKDIRQQTWMNDINQKYLPSSAYDQAFTHQNSGNKVNKYALGQAVLFTPFFLVAHAFAAIAHSIPADGYSMPYQIAIWLGGFLISVLGLIFLRKILNSFYEDKITGWVLMALGLGTNWMEYAAISNGMNHTWLFTLLCALLLFTIRFYKKPDWTASIGIGLCFGLAVLTRPTEIIWMMIPLLWGIDSIRERMNYLFQHRYKVLTAIIISSGLIFLQSIYWKYASGEWIVFSYGDQEFHWLHPAIKRGLIGANTGWWLYSPMMLPAVLGFVILFIRQKAIFWALCTTSILAIYITLSWGHWESGGGLGQRNLIQIYPLLAFPLASLLSLLNRSTPGKIIWILFLTINIYYTGWWLHQAHKGGFFKPGQMTRMYILNIAGRLNPDPDYMKLLDTQEYFKGDPKAPVIILEEGFDNDSLGCEFSLPGSHHAACLNAQQQYIGPITVPINPSCNDWIRLEADFIMNAREWDVWKNAQWIVQFFKGEENIKTNFIRIQRLIPEENRATHLFFDVRIPGADFDRCVVTMWNAGSTQTLVVDNLKVVCHDGK